MPTNRPKFKLGQVVRVRQSPIEFVHGIFPDMVPESLEGAVTLIEKSLNPNLAADGLLYRVGNCVWFWYADDLELPDGKRRYKILY